MATPFDERCIHADPPLPPRLHCHNCTSGWFSRGCSARPSLIDPSCRQAMAAEAALEQSMLNSDARPRRSSTSTTSLTALEFLRPRIPVAAPHTQMNATGSSRTRISPAPTSVLESQQYRDMEARALAAESRLATPRGTAAARERELETLRSRNQTLEREIEDLHSRTKRLRGR